MVLSRNLKFILPVVLITLTFGYAFVQLISGETTEETAKPAVLDEFAALETVAVLAFVFLLLAVFAWLAKRYFSPLHALKRNDRLLKILDSMPVSPKSKIILVEVANETLLLGVTEQTINVLTDIEIAPKVVDKQEMEKRPHRFLSYIREINKTESGPLSSERSKGQS